MTALRVAVIGVGHLGQHHARLLASMEGVCLAGVADVRRDRAEEIAARHSTAAFTSASGLLGRADAVTIAAPTSAHVEIALPFVESGVPVLVEKPIASSLGCSPPRRGAASRWPSATRSASTLPSRRRCRSSPSRGSSRSTGSARFPSAASTSTSCSTS
jgi:hypothetical protein